MKTLANACLIALTCGIVACGSSTSTDGGTGTDGGASGTPDGGSGTESFTATGTFTASNTDAGTVSATMSPVVTISGSPDFTGFFELTISDQGSLVPSGGTLTFSSPSGIDSEEFDVNINFPGTEPTTGTFTATTSGFCGEISMIYSNAALTISNDFQGGSQGGCPTATPDNVGSWTLTISSLTEGPTSNNITYYTAHGSLSATLVDQSMDMGTVSLTF